MHNKKRWLVASNHLNLVQRPRRGLCRRFRLRRFGSRWRSIRRRSPVSLGSMSKGETYHDQLLTCRDMINLAADNGGDEGSAPDDTSAVILNQWHE